MKKKVYNCNFIYNKETKEGKASYRWGQIYIKKTNEYNDWFLQVTDKLGLLFSWSVKGTLPSFILKKGKREIDIAKKNQDV